MLHVRDFSQRKQTNAERWRGEVQTNWGYGGSYDDFVKSIMDTKPLPSWMQSPKYNIKK